MCPHTDVVDVNEEDLMRIYGETECATCADAPARRTIEMGLERADREEWTRHVSAASSTFGADASLIEEAITAWQFYATHTDLLNAPVVAFDAFMRALMSPPSQMSWALFRDVHCALTAQIIPTAEIMRDIVIEVRSNEDDARVKRLSRYESPLHVHSWPDITRNLIESVAYKMDVKLAGFRASALLARVDYFPTQSQNAAGDNHGTREHRVETIKFSQTRRGRASRERRASVSAEGQRRDPPRGASTSRDAMLTVQWIHVLDQRHDQRSSTLVRVRSEMLRFLKISSDHWRRQAWMVDLVGALMRQCQTWTSISIPSG